MAADKQLVREIAEYAEVETGKTTADRVAVPETPAPHVDAQGRMTFYWKDQGIRVIVEGIERKPKTLECFVTVLYKNGTRGEDAKPQTLMWKSHHNFRSNSSVESLVRSLGRVLDRQWQVRIEGVKEYVDTLHSTGDPMVRLADVPDPGPVRYAVAPLLEEGEHNVLFADGNSTKSFLAEAMCLSVASGKSTVPNVAVTTPGKALYVDLEANKGIHSYRLRKLSAGVKASMPETIYYKRIHSSLVDAAEEIGRLIAEQNFSLVVVDTGGAAVLGQYNDEAAVMSYYLACRAWGRTVLTLLHIPKYGDKDRPIGTTVWYNQARVAWEMVKVQASGDDEAKLDLICKKSNNSRPPKPLAWTLHFAESGFYYTAAQIGHTGLGRQDLVDQIEQYLLREGKVTAREIADALGKEINRVSEVLTQYKDRRFGCSDDRRDRLWWVLPKEAVQGVNSPLNKALVTPYATRSVARGEDARREQEVSKGDAPWEQEP